MARPLQRRAAAFLPVHDGEDAEDAAPRRFDRRDGIGRRLASGDHVLDDDDGGTGRERPFDTLAGPVGFRLFTDGEGVARSVSTVRRSGDGVGDGLGTQRETADQGRGPAPGREALESQGTDQREPFPRHGGAARIDVEARAAPGSEGEVAVHDRSLAQQLAEASLQITSAGHGSIVVAFTTTILSCVERHASTRRTSPPWYPIRRTPP